MRLITLRGEHSRRRNRRAANYCGKKLTHRKRAHTHAHIHRDTHTHTKDYALPLHESLRYAKVPRSRSDIPSLTRCSSATWHCFYHRLPLRLRSIVLDATLSPLRSLAQRKKRPWGYRLRASTRWAARGARWRFREERRRDYYLMPRVNLSIERSLVSLERPAVISRARATSLTDNVKGREDASGYIYIYIVVSL